MEHSTFPRISSFSAETIKSMVLADSLCRSGGSSDFEFGKSQVSTQKNRIYFPKICSQWYLYTIYLTSEKERANL